MYGERGQGQRQSGESLNRGHLNDNDRSRGLSGYGGFQQGNNQRNNGESYNRGFQQGNNQRHSGESRNRGFDRQRESSNGRRNNDIQGQFGRQNDHSYQKQGY